MITVHHVDVQNGVSMAQAAWGGGLSAERVLWKGCCASACHLSISEMMTALSLEAQADSDDVAPQQPKKNPYRKHEQFIRKSGEML